MGYIVPSASLRRTTRFSSLPLGFTGRIKFLREEHVDDIGMGSIDPGKGFLLILHIVDAFCISLTPDIIYLPSLEKDIDGGTLQFDRRTAGSFY